MSVVNFKRIGQLVDSVSRFQHNVEQAFKQVNECFDRKTLYIEKSETVTHSVSATGILPLTKLPKGTYKVTIGASWVFMSAESATAEGNVYATLNGSELFDTSGEQFRAGTNAHSSIRTEAYDFGPEVSRIVEFTKELNSFSLNVEIGVSSLLRAPRYTIEKIENFELITNEWT